MDEQPDDSLLYAVVIGILYAFIMVFLVLANIHPSRSLLADLEGYDGSTDVNLNEDVLPLELSHILKAGLDEHQFKDPQKLVWPKMPCSAKASGQPSAASRFPPPAQQVAYHSMHSQLTKSAYF